MGRKKGSIYKSTTALGNQNLTLREENSGRKDINVSSMLKLEHLQKLATWASSETSIPSLAALYGQRLAASAESVAVPLGRALFICQRCETVLQPGDNCTIRIESNRVKLKRKKMPGQQNNIVYTCLFCSHRNRVRGSGKGCVKELLSSRVKRNSDIKEACNEDAAVKSHVHGDAKDIPMTLGTPITACGIVSSGKTIKSFGVKSCKAGSNKNGCVGMDGGNVSGGSSKRKRRQWSSLKDIVAKNDVANDVDQSNLVIPLKF